MPPDWKPILDAIVGARHGGGVEGLAARLRDLDARYPHTPEIAAELAFTLASSGDQSGALAAYERALVLGLASPAEQANTLVGHAVCLLRLDRPADAAAALERARAQFPEHAEFAAYLAVALHRAGRAEAAFTLLLDTLLNTSDDIGLSAHQRTLRNLL